MKKRVSLEWKVAKLDDGKKKKAKYKGTKFHVRTLSEQIVRIR